MTKSTRTIPIDANVDLAGLLALAEAGTTTLLTRGGIPVVAVGPAPDDLPPARETVTAYAAGPAIAAAQPAPALTRLIGGQAARSVLRIFLNDPDQAIH